LAGSREGQSAGLPEGDHLLQAGEQAGEGGKYQGVQRRDQAGLGGAEVGFGTHGGGEAGGVLGQGSGRSD